MYLAHGPLSFVLNERIQKKNISKLTKGEHISIALLSIFFGILPDFDLFLLSIINVPTFNHHQSFTHSILFWIILWMFLRIGIYAFKRIANTKTKKVLNDAFLNILHKSFLIGAISHLLADILFSRAQILFPLSTEVTILGGVLDKNYFTNNLFTVSMSVEILILLVFLFFVYKDFIKESKIFESVIYTCIAISICFILLSVYMSVNMYNNAIYIENGKIQNDADYDTLIDYQDPDTNNDGVDNIVGVDKYELANDVERIIEGEYLIGNERNILGKISYLYGGFSSYRLVSQAFFEQNLPIEPVLNNFARNEYNIRGYLIENSYEDILYEYFEKNSLLMEFDVNVERGNLLFILGDNGKVVNEGIVLGNNSVGIILENDTRTRIHTVEEVYKNYHGYILKVQKDY